MSPTMYMERLPQWLRSRESVCSAGDKVLIPGSKGFPEEGIGNPSNICLGEIPWTEEPGGLQSMGCKKVRHSDQTTTKCKEKKLNM